jgi:hypothetical protein
MLRMYASIMHFLHDKGASIAIKNAGIRARLYARVRLCGLCFIRDLGEAILRRLLRLGGRLGKRNLCLLENANGPRPRYARHSLPEARHFFSFFSPQSQWIR